MEFDGIRLEIEDRIATITLARPEKRNALSLDMLRNLIKAFEAVPPEAGVVILAAEGNCEGAMCSLRKTISLVNKEEYETLAAKSGSDIVLNKKTLASNEILTFIRQSEVISVMHMHGFDAEVVDLLAAPGSPVTRKPLDRLFSNLSGHIIIGSIFRDGVWSTAIGSTHIREGDRALVFCNADYLKEVRKLFSA